MNDQLLSYEKHRVIRSQEQSFPPKEDTYVGCSEDKTDKKRLIRRQKEKRSVTEQLSD